MTVLAAPPPALPTFTSGFGMPGDGGRCDPSVVAPSLTSSSVLTSSNHVHLRGTNPERTL